MNVAALGEGLNLIEKVGIQNIKKHNTLLSEYLKEKLQSSGRTFWDHPSRSSILSFSASEEEYQKLTKAKIQTSNQTEAIRVSPHFYNTTEDIDRLIEILG